MLSTWYRLHSVTEWFYVIGIIFTISNNYLPIQN